MNGKILIAPKRRATALLNGDSYGGAAQPDDENISVHFMYEWIYAHRRLVPDERYIAVVCLRPSLAPKGLRPQAGRSPAMTKNKITALAV
jgi:hypothetical protein